MGAAGAPACRFGIGLALVGAEKLYRLQGVSMVAWPNPMPDAGPSVLIADDSRTWRDAVGEVLSREGFRTLEAADGEEAVEVVRCERLDVVLIDFHMPRLDGLGALRIIRRERRRLPSVLMTAHPTDVPPEEVRALRIATVLAKPADRRVIVTTVTRVMCGEGEDEVGERF